METTSKRVEGKSKRPRRAYEIVVEGKHVVCAYDQEKAVEVAKEWMSEGLNVKAVVNGYTGRVVWRPVE